VPAAGTARLDLAAALSPGGVTMAMADGGVHFINESIDYIPWVVLGDKADSDFVTLL
jgi:hypothetical protein